MVHLDCSGVWFGSQLDEKHLFEWAVEIPGVLRWEQDTLVVKSRLSEASLRDLLALFSRYEIPMKQLAQFATPVNAKWFKTPDKYWHKRVFGQQSNLSLESGRAKGARRST
jgi:hypothetical protein